MFLPLFGWQVSEECDLCSDHILGTRSTFLAIHKVQKKVIQLIVLIHDFGD